MIYMFDRYWQVKYVCMFNFNIFSKNKPVLYVKSSVFLNFVD